MGKSATFVCVIALGIILIASGDTGGDDGLSEPNVTNESTSVEENAAQKRTVKNGDQRELTFDGGKMVESSARMGQYRQERENEAKLTENSTGNDTIFVNASTARSLGGRSSTYTDLNSSVCASPPEIKGAVTPVIEGTNHPLETSVTYSCPLGYVSRSTINHISVCRMNIATGKAQWTVPEMNCSPRSCGDPGYVNNARRIGNLFTFPNKVEYECEEGYKLRGLHSRYCQAGGEWSGRLPTCEQIYCSIPKDPINGRVTYSSLKYGTELKYECNVGFLLKEDEPRYCSGNGIWSDEEPECIEATCEEPQPPKHGTVTLHGDLKVGSLATYSCDPGRRLVGATTTKCLNSGKWTFDAPECLSPCKVPFIESGEMGRYEIRYSTFRNYEEFKKVLAGENVDSGETLTLRCKSGSLPVENSEFLENNRLEVTCEDGTWSKEMQCKQTKCSGPPPPSKNARPVIVSRDHGFTIWYTCTYKNDKKIEGKVTCHFGSWIGVPPRCVSQPCYTKDLNYPGLIKPAEEIFGSSESFQVNCEIGYKKARRLQNITCASGRWDISQSPCKHENDEGRIIATTETIKTSQEEKIQPSVSVEPSSSRPTDANPNGDCSCTLNYEDPSGKVQLGNKILKKGNKINLDETVSLGCKNNNILEWRNGFRFFGSAYMTCSTCKKWQRHDLPTCSGVVVAATYISLDEDLKILPGGIIDVPIGETRRFPCISSYGRPQWDFGERRNVMLVPHSFRDRGTIFYVSYLDIVQAAVRNNGTYQCFLRGTHGTKFGSSYLHVQVEGGEDRSISTPQPRVTSSGTATQPSVNVESSSEKTYVDKYDTNDCCIYENVDQVVNAQIGGKILKFGDRIRKGENVSFECRIFPKALTWKNGLKLHRKVNMTCNTCKKWQEKDVPVCKNVGTYDTVINFQKDLNVLPGGIVTIQNGERHQFSCISSWRQPEWDFGQRIGVYVTKTTLSGIEGGVHYISYLDIEKEADQLDGEYTCYLKNYLGQRVGSTILHLQMNDYVSCPEFPLSPELQVTYSNDVSVGSIATFKCSESTRYLNGSNFSECLRNGSWSNPLPSCEDPKCSIYNLAMSIPEGVEPDTLNETQEYVTVGSEVRLKCSENKVMTGDSKAQCGEQGQWILGKFECVMGCLLNLDPSSHLIVQPIQDSYRVGDFVYPSCPPGEEMSSKVERLMCLPGHWSENLPSCKESKKKGQR